MRRRLLTASPSSEFAHVVPCPRAAVARLLVSAGRPRTFAGWPSDGMARSDDAGPRSDRRRAATMPMSGATVRCGRPTWVMSRLPVRSDRVTSPMTPRTVDASRDARPSRRPARPFESADRPIWCAARDAVVVCTRACASWPRNGAGRLGEFDL